MIIPEQLLLALTELLSGNAAQAPNDRFLQRYGYKITKSDWSCFLAEAGNDPWYFRLLGPIICDAKVISSASDAGAIPWSISKQLSEQVQNSIQGMDIGLRLDDPTGDIYVIYSESFGNVLGVRCKSLQLVATALQTWGKPPQSVICDWQNQLDSLSEQAIRPSTAETLVTEDGILIPLSGVLNQLDVRDRAKAETRAAVGNLPVPGAASHFSPAPDWPVRTPSEESQNGLALAVPISDRNKSTGTLPRKRKTKLKMLSIGAAAAIIFILTLTVWLLSPVKKSPEELIASLNVPKTPVTPMSGDEAANVNDPNAAELQELVITAEPNGSIAEASSLQPDLTIEALLAQLRPNQVRSPTLNTLSASLIISEALSPAGKDLPTITTDGIAEVAEASDTKALNTVHSERGTVSLERPLRIQAAITKETVTIGKLVLVKACRCEIELKLAEKLIVEPGESLTIEGAGKASWRIAIEDEVPELVVEIASKPGAKWQVIAAIGLRESPGAIPIWLGPREAQIVGNRLIEYRQWIRNAIETLRTARSNSRGRSNIDFGGEIKKLERQEREAEKAIDQWKVIARLSHFFFDSNEVQIRFTAVEKL